MTEQNINPNDNYPEETPQGDFNEISAFQDAEGAIEPVNADGEVVPFPEEVTQSSPNADDDQNQIGENPQDLGEVTSAGELQERELSEDAESASGEEQPKEQPAEPLAAPS